jgi:hypothetical protein
MAYKLDNLSIPPGIDQENITDEQAQQIIDNFLNTYERTDVAPSFDLNAFFGLVKNAIESKQNTENIPSDKRLLFVEEDPPENIDTEAITFELLKRENGSFSRGAPFQGNVKEIKPHIRAERQHPEHPGERLVTFGKRYDNLVGFNIYARSNAQARERLLWFEGLMLSYSWYFKIFGFKTYFFGTGKRERVEIEGTKLTKYPSEYYVGTDDIYHIGYQELKRVIIATVENN